MTAVAASGDARPGSRPEGDALGENPGSLPEGLLRYIAATTWLHQFPLVALTIAVFLLEVVPLELQRRVINDVSKHREYGAIVLICAAYLGAVGLQGSIKLGLNIYRAWVGERAKRSLRRRICAGETAGATFAQSRGTAVSMVVAEIEPIGNFIGASLSEPLLQTGILATVIAYIIHVDTLMGAVALALFAPQLVFVPLMQHAMNRRTGARVWLLRQIGAGVIARKAETHTLDPIDSARIDRVFHLNMGIFEFKFTMNFLMNLCSHLQIIAALLIGGWRVVQGDLEIGGVVAFISGIGRLNDPWGDLVNYFRDLSVTEVKFKLLTGAATRPIPALLARVPTGD